MCGFSRCKFFAVAWLLLSCGVMSSPVSAINLTDRLLPETTVGYVMTKDTARLEADFDKTQIGQLLEDPSMQPFLETFRAQLRDTWFPAGKGIGVSWEDMEGVPGGETSLAIVHPAPEEASLALIVDVTGHRENAVKLLDKIWNHLTEQQAKREDVIVGSAKVAVFRLPPSEDRRVTTVAFFLEEDVLCVTDHEDVARQIVRRLTMPDENESLASVAAYQHVSERCAADAGGGNPHIHWFIEPFGYVEARRLMDPKYKPPRQDMLKILQEQGFSSINGLGGVVELKTDRHEMLHRTALYAPGAADAVQEFPLAARMLMFPAEGELNPPSWVPRELATYTGLNWDMKNAFEASSTLIDAIAEDKIFEDTLETLRTDPNAGEIDIRNDLIGNLGQNVVVLSDNVLDSDEELTKSERTLFAASTHNPDGLAALIEKQMATDPDGVKIHVIAGVRVWEVLPQEYDSPEVGVEFPGRRFDNYDDEFPDDEDRRPFLKANSVAVADGYLLVASHFDFLKRVLEGAGNGQQLSKSSDFQLVEAELKQLAEESGGVPSPANWSVRTFSRTDEEHRLTYELLRQGKMPESESILGRLLNSLMGEEKDGIARAQQIDGSELPDYEIVRRYLGPAGIFGIVEEQGWFLKGFTLAK